VPEKVARRAPNGCDRGNAVVGESINRDGLDPGLRPPAAAEMNGAYAAIGCEMFREAPPTFSASTEAVDEKQGRSFRLVTEHVHMNLGIRYLDDHR